MVIDEHDAFQLAQSLPTLKPETQKRASLLLADYRDQQAELGEPLWPTQIKLSEERLFGIVSNPKLLDEENGLYAEADLTKPGFGDELRSREATANFLSSRFDRPLDEVRKDHDLFRNHYAQENWDEWGELNDGEFLGRAKKEMEGERQKKEADKLAFWTGAKAALSGEGIRLKAIREFQAANKDASPNEFIRAYDQFAAPLAKHHGLITGMIENFGRTMNGQGSDEDRKARNAAISQLAALPVFERRAVLAKLATLAKAKGEKVDKGGKPVSHLPFSGLGAWLAGGAQEAGESAFRMFAGMSSNRAETEDQIESVPHSGSVIVDGEIKTLEDARKFVAERTVLGLAQSSVNTPELGSMPPLVLPGGKEITLDENASSLIREAKKQAMREIQLGREFDALMQETDPVKGVIASTAGSSLAIMGGMYLMRGKAVPMLAKGYANLEYDQMRLKYPGADRSTLRAAADISGAGQAVLDLVGFKALDKLPGLKSLLANSTDKVLALRAGSRIAGVTGAENVVEGLQDAATPLVLNALKSDVPGYNWDAELKEWKQNRLDVFIGLLPLTLLGVGASTVQEIRGVRSILSDNDALMRSGVVEADRIKIIDLAAEGKLVESGQALKEAWTRRSPELAAEANSDTAEAARQAETKAAEQAIAEAEQQKLIPRIRRDAQGWMVEDETGELVRVASREEAVNAAYSHYGEMEFKAAAAMAEMADSFMAGADVKGGEAFEIAKNDQGVQDEVDAGRVSVERAAQNVEIFAKLHGIPEAEAKKMSFAVLGSNVEETKENVRQFVSRIFGGGNVATVMHEGIHGRWRSSGISHERGLGWVRMGEQITGQKFLNSENDADISPETLDEAIAELATAELIGRRKDGSRFTPGLISRGLSAAILSERGFAKQQAKAKGQKATVKEAGLFATWLKYWKGIWGEVLKTARALAKARREGKITQDFDDFLDELLAVSPQERHEAAAVKEGGGIAGEIDASFSLAPAQNASAPSPGGLNEAEVADILRRFPATLKGRKSYFVQVFNDDYSDSPSWTPVELDDKARIEGSTSSLRKAIRQFLSTSPKQPRRIVYHDGTGKDGRFGWEPRLQTVFEDSFEARLRHDYPSMPDRVVKAILRNRNPNNPDTYLVTQAHVRHNYTDYEDRLQAVGDEAINPRIAVAAERRAARDDIEELVNAKLSEWEQEAPLRLGAPVPARQAPDPAGNSGSTAGGGSSTTGRMASDSGAAQSNEPSPGGLNEADVIRSIGPRIAAKLVKRKTDRVAPETLSFSFEPADDPAFDGDGYFYPSWRAPTYDDKYLEKFVPLPTISISAKNDGFYVGDGVEKFSTLNEAKEAVRAGIEEYLSENSGSYNINLDGKESAREVFDEAGQFFDRFGGEWGGSKWGSWYYNTTDKDGREIKISIRDHEATRKDMGLPDKAWEVSKRWEADEVADALAKAFEWLKANAESAGRGGLAFSLAPRQSLPAFADTVMAARMGKPAFKEGFYRAAREKLAKLRIAQRWGKKKQDQMAALRTLDAILSAFPPEVRGRVGGFVKLAGLGTDASREAEIARRLDKLEGVLEKAARKHYGDKIEKMIERFSSQKGENKKRSGKLTASQTEAFDYLKWFTAEDEAGQKTEIAGLEKALQDAETHEEQQEALAKYGLATMFYQVEEQASENLETASNYLEDEVATGRLQRAVLDEARKAELGALRKSAREEASQGEALSKTDADNQIGGAASAFRNSLESIRGIVAEASWTLIHQIEHRFGRDSKVTRHFVERIIKAHNEQVGIRREAEEARRKAMAEIFGTSNPVSIAGRLAKLSEGTDETGVYLEEDGQSETKSIPIFDAQRIVGDPDAFGYTQDEANRIEVALQEAAGTKKKNIEFSRVTRQPTPKQANLSQLEALQYWLSWQQAGLKEAMQKTGWTDSAAEALDKFLLPETRGLAAWLRTQYDMGRDLIDPVHRRVYHSPLAVVSNYAPAVRQHTKGDSVTALEMAHQTSGLEAGFIKLREKSNSPMRKVNALSVYMHHLEAIAHWVSHVELVRDMKAVMRDNAVRTAVVAQQGQGAMSRLETRITALEQQGLERAMGMHHVNSFWNKLNQFRALKGLAFRIAPLVKQFSAMINPLLYDVPASAYVARLGKLLNGKLVVKMWESKSIQNRLFNGFSPEARAAAEGYGINGSRALTLMQTGMMPINFMDAGWNTAGAAIAWDYYRATAKKVNPGIGDEAAEAEATKRLDEMLFRTAQPQSNAARSTVELSHSAFVKAMTLFLSETRKTAGIELDALYALASGKSKDKALDAQRAIVAHFVMGAVTQLAASLWMTLGDDEDREDAWSAETWARAILAGPLNGIMAAGSVYGVFSDWIFGSKGFSQRGMTDELKAMGRIDLDALFDASEPGDFIRAWEKVFSGIGGPVSALGLPAAGLPSVLLNPVKEAVDKLEN